MIREVGTPNLVSAASRLTHRVAGSFDIDMPLSGTSGVEDRDGSGSFLAVFTFDAPVTSGNAHGRGRHGHGWHADLQRQRNAGPAQRTWPTYRS